MPLIPYGGFVSVTLRDGYHENIPVLIFAHNIFEAEALALKVIEKGEFIKRMLPVLYAVPRLTQFAHISNISDV